MRRIIGLRRGTSAGDRIQEGFATLAAIRAFPTTDILDKTVAVLEGVGLFAYDSTGVGVDDGISIITPNSNIGRWFSVLGGSPPPVSSPPSIVYRPGGVALDNVHITWANTAAALAAIVGKKLLSVDDSIVSPAPVTSGSVDLGDVTAVGYSNVVSAALTFQDGAVCTKFFARAERLAMTVAAGKTQPVLSVSSGVHVTELDGCSVTTAIGATQPFFRTTGGTLAINLRQSTISTGVTPSVRTTGAGATIINALDASSIATATISDDGVGTTTVNYDGASLVSEVHAAATKPPTFVALEDSDVSPYTAGLPGYSSTPASVQDASADTANIGPVIYGASAGLAGGPYWASVTNGLHPCRMKLRRGLLAPTDLCGVGWWLSGDGKVVLAFIPGVGYHLAFAANGTLLPTLIGSPIPGSEWPWEAVLASGNLITFYVSVDGYKWESLISIDVSLAPYSTTTAGFAGAFVQGTAQLLIERSDVQ